MANLKLNRNDVVSIRPQIGKKAVAGRVDRIVDGIVYFYGIDTYQGRNFSAPESTFQSGLYNTIEVSWDHVIETTK